MTKRFGRNLTRAIFEGLRGSRWGKAQARDAAAAVKVKVSAGRVDLAWVRPRTDAQSARGVDTGCRKIVVACPEPPRAVPVPVRGERPLGGARTAGGTCRSIERARRVMATLRKGRAR